LRAAQRKTGKLARLSQTLYREDGQRTLVGEGKVGRHFWGSQVCLADFRIDGKSSMSIGVWLEKKQRQILCKNYSRMRTQTGN